MALLEGVSVQSRSNQARRSIFGFDTRNLTSGGMMIMLLYPCILPSYTSNSPEGRIYEVHPVLPFGESGVTWNRNYSSVL